MGDFDWRERNEMERTYFSGTRPMVGCQGYLVFFSNPRGGPWARENCGSVRFKQSKGNF